MCSFSNFENVLDQWPFGLLFEEDKRAFFYPRVNVSSITGNTGRKRQV